VNTVVYVNTGGGSMTSKRVSDEQMIEAIKVSKNIKSTLTLLGMAPCGGNYKTLHGCVKRHQVDISHFTKGGYQPGYISKARFSNEELFVENSKCARSKLKARIIQENLIPYTCLRCNTNEWQGETLSLHLDHINGVRDDNRLENLRFLCPNCHSLTDTYCGKANKLPPKLCKCGEEICRDSESCKSCYEQPTKITWPPDEELYEMLSNSSFVAVGKQLGVSDNAIRKHLKL
jgi:hypothetical protein